MHIANEGRAFSREVVLPLGVSGEELAELSRVGHAIDAYVDHRCSRFDELWRDHPRTPNRSDQNVGTAANTRKVAGFRMTYRDCRVVVQQQHGNRLADNIAAADYYRFDSGNGNATALQYLHHACRSARH